MVRHCDFSEQSSIAGDDSTLRPDLVVRTCPAASTSSSTPRRRCRACSTPTRRATRRSASATCATTPGCCASTSSSLADKAYWSGLDSAPDFVVMFLPGEHLYGAALEADPALIEDAMARAGADRHPDHAAGHAARGRLRLAAGAGGRVRAGDLRARPRAARPAGQALHPAGHARHAPQQHGAGVQRDRRLLRGPRAARRPPVRRARRGGRGPGAARARAGHAQRPQRARGRAGRGRRPGRIAAGTRERRSRARDPAPARGTGRASGDRPRGWRAADSRQSYWA